MKSPLDPVFASDRDRGATPPEAGTEGANVVGRPLDGAQAGFHEPAESRDTERREFNEEQADEEGGSYDGLGVPVADDAGQPKR